MRSTPIWLRRLVMGGVSALTVGGLAAFVAPAAHATSSFALTRLSGPNRYATAADIAEKTFTTANTVLVASGTNFPDALAASYLAGNETGGAPILLTDPNSLSPETSAALTTLAAKNVIIVGGTSAVSSNVQTQLAAIAGVTVTRVAGTVANAGRFDTMQAIDSQTGANAVGTSGGLKTAILATGDNFPDALGAGPLAYGDHFPLVLTDGAQTTLSPQALTVLNTDAIKRVIVVGGTAAINQAQLTQLAAVNGGITIDQQAGANRSATSEALAKDGTANYGLVKTHFNVANGNDPTAKAVGGLPAGFTPDALSGAPHGGKELAPTLITNSPSDAGAATDYATSVDATVTGGHIFGGTDAITAATQTAIETAGKAGGNGGAIVTALPQLVSAALVGTVDPVNGATVAYTFSKPVVTAAGPFKLYTAADVPVSSSNATVQTGGTVVNVVFPTLTTTASLASYTLATVPSGAVTATGGKQNPDGSAPFGSGTSAGTLTPGVTNAPNLTIVNNFRPAMSGNNTLVDFTFDKAPTVAAGAVFDLVTTTNGLVTCNSIAPTVVGDVVTVSCPDISGSTPITAANVARAVVASGVTGGTGTGSPFTTPLESLNVTGTPPNTTGNDLSSVTLTPATTTGGQSTATFTFTGPAIAPGPGSNFQLFTQSGTVLAGTGTTTVGGTGNNVVVVNFAGGPTAFNNVVGANVLASGGPTGIQPASFAVAGTGTAATAAGTVDAPQLTAVSLTKGTDPFSNTTYLVTYTFSQALATTGFTPGDFHLYQGDATGTQVNPTSCAVSTTANTTVTCLATSSTTPTATTVGTTVLGTVDAGAVTGAATTSGHTNPEGAQATTGGTGTPAT